MRCSWRVKPESKHGRKSFLPTHQKGFEGLFAPRLALFWDFSRWRVLYFLAGKLVVWFVEVQPERGMTVAQVPLMCVWDSFNLGVDVNWFLFLRMGFTIVHFVIVRKRCSLIAMQLFTNHD